MSNLLNICICNVSFCTFHSETFPPRRRELNSIKILTSKIEIQFHIVPNLILPKPALNQTKGDSLLCGGITLITHFMELKLRQNLKMFLDFWCLSTKSCLMTHKQIVFNEAPCIIGKRTNLVLVIPVWVSALLSASSWSSTLWLVEERTFFDCRWRI